MLLFSTQVWVKNLNAKKTQSQAVKGHFLGFDKGSKGYRIYWPGKHRVTIEQNMYPTQNAALGQYTKPMMIEGGEEDPVTVNLPEFSEETQREYVAQEEIPNKQCKHEEPLSPLTTPPATPRENTPQPAQVQQPCSDGLIPSNGDFGHGKRVTHQPGQYRPLAGMVATIAEEDLNELFQQSGFEVNTSYNEFALTASYGSEPNTLDEALA
ncbi:hypothetical protein DACRYDRAFT_15757 [Dacryopinax primogenitus]|uniref:Retroviral polymerase SH3-like domain-containing protein n=1 Tax=Dacryopinax primogenitus (strain DJM 731) TaxID=1858805 RepID=M5G0S3_DACPD|nr:uncharacterized protein DACRYDRAFT_15757 [Dacryopinax primogenitus]EJU01715.1 hypothetical protein DACRYDRAFT_15757 [Dacryopinax primogenitus]